MEIKLFTYLYLYLYTSTYRLAAAPKKHIKHTSQSENRSFGGYFLRTILYMSHHQCLYFFSTIDGTDIRVFPSRPLFFFFSLETHWAL